MVPADPSIEDMRRCVCDENKRPTVPNRWSECQVCHSARICTLFRETFLGVTRNDPFDARMLGSQAGRSFDGVTRQKECRRFDGIVSKRRNESNLIAPIYCLVEFRVVLLYIFYMVMRTRLWESAFFGSINFFVILL